LRTDAATAELVKLVENAYRDVNIAFANELSLICDQLGLNVWRVIELANRDPRVSILQPGPGVGGHCIAVDPWFIVWSAPERTRLIRTAREVNDAKPNFVVSQIRERAERFKRPVVACLGLTYKPDVDDTRESPAIEIASLLAAAGQERILVADPNLPACRRNSHRCATFRSARRWRRCVKPTSSRCWWPIRPSARSRGSS
jgi:UDP-N-acetyl-D-mannosaminuronic acid dehydrogenase